MTKHSTLWTSSVDEKLPRFTLDIQIPAKIKGMLTGGPQMVGYWASCDIGQLVSWTIV